MTPSTQASGVQATATSVDRRFILLGLFALIAVIASLVAGVSQVLAAPLEADSATLAAPDVENDETDDVRIPVELGTLSDDVLGELAGSDSDGTGIDVALIDTGVAAVDGLIGGQVLHGPDMSSESADPETYGLDSHGHGTHLAGIIAGDRTGHEGIAPGSRIVSVKVAGRDGNTSAAQVVAAIDWVVANRNTEGRNIRVLNLAYGNPQVSSHLGDPISAAVERAWQAGIVVVVAAGNDGDAVGHLGSPAVDPYVLVVGSTDSRSGLALADQPVPAFSQHGDGVRNPDLVAPGRSIASYRAPGSAADEDHASGRHGDDLFLGSGTSQSAAVVSGVAARLLDAYPGLTPDQLKETLRSSSHTNLDLAEAVVGSGAIDAEAAWSAPAFDAEAQSAVPATAGALAGSGTMQGNTWHGATWHGATWHGATWHGATWHGATWHGNTWHGATWHGNTWHGATWHGNTWHGATWHGNTWHGNTWHGNTWHGNTWHGNTWHGATWHGNTWHGATWHGNTWHGATWHGNTWHGNTWHGNTWHGNTWHGNTWHGNTWHGNTWHGATWHGNTWHGNTWHGATWHGNTWHGATWHGATWHGATWHGNTWH